MSTAFQRKDKMIAITVRGLPWFEVGNLLLLLYYWVNFISKTSVCDINSFVRLAVCLCISDLFDSDFFFGLCNFILRQIYKCQIGHNHNDQEEAEHCNRTDYYWYLIIFLFWLKNSYLYCLLLRTVDRLNWNESSICANKQNISFLGVLWYRPCSISSW